MNKVWITIGAIGLLATALLIATRGPRDPGDAEVATSAKDTSAPQVPQSGTEPQATAPDRVSAAPDNPTDIEPAPEETKETFRTDANGKLVLDEQTRLKLEEFFARTDPRGVDIAALDLVRELPAAAAGQALDIVDRYRNYQAAQDATYTDEGPGTIEDAIVQLESLHTLRVEHFGTDVAKAFYGQEERLSRELIELMRLEKDQSLTMEEKADRAQRLRDTLPAVSAAEKGQRPPPPN